MRMFGKRRRDPFDRMLAEVAGEVWQEQMDAIPSREELDEIITFSPGFLSRMERLTKKVRKQEKRRKDTRAAAAIAAAFAAAWILANPGSVARAAKACGDALKEWLDSYAVFSFEQVENPEYLETGELSGEQGLPKFRLGYVPEGFEFVYEASTDFLYKVCYAKNGEEDYLIFTYSKDKGDWGEDNEENYYTTITGKKDIIYYCLEQIGENDTKILWKDNSAIYYRISGPVSKAELLKIIENIKN